MSHSSHTPAPVLISLTSFGAAEVGRHGQLWFARLSVEAGADGVEAVSYTHLTLPTKA